MNLAADARLALRSLLRTPGRSLLVLQGIAWGVGVAIFPAAVLQGSRDAAIRDAAEVGTGRIAVTAEAGGRPLTEADGAALRESLRGRYQSLRVAAYRVLPGRQAAAGGAGATVDLVAADDEVLGALDVPLRTGVLPAGSPGEPVPCVPEPAVALALLGTGDGSAGTIDVSLPSGAPLRLRVVGRAGPRSPRALRTDDLGLDTDHAFHGTMTRLLRAMGVAMPDVAWKRSGRAVFVPLWALPREGDAVDGLLLRTLPQEAPQLAEAVRAALVDRGAAPLVHANLVWPVLASRRIEHYMRLKDALVLACLAMGGVVIANVLLLAVMERTAEIAVRRAEGATRGDIAAQFLVEAGVLGVVGAALGVPLGLTLAWLRVSLAPYSTMSVSFPVGVALVACAWAVTVALVAGVLPARRAAALDPVQALRGG